MKSLTRSIEKEHKGKIIFSYKGIPSGEMIHSIIHLAEAKLDFIKSGKPLRKKVFRIIVEILQNILHQEEELDVLKYPSFIFYLVKERDQYIILTCNRLIKETAIKVKERIKSFMNLTQSEQRETYLNILGNGRFTDKGGAGLGLLEIVRSSNGNFHYEILPSEIRGYRILYFKIKVAES
jgi:hypothetical protein